MAAPVPLIQFWFDLSATGGAFFTLNSATRGVLDGATYLLAGDLATDVTHYVTSLQVTRGRSRQTDEFRTGTASLTVRNSDRRFDPYNTAGPYYGNIRPGKQVTLSANGVTFYDGHIDDLQYSFDTDRQSVATFTCVDALGSLAAMQMTEWTTTAGETAGPRITSVLDRSEINYPASRVLGTGASTLQGDLVADGTNVLEYLQLVSRTDLGRLFASRLGALTFRDRYSTAVVTGGRTPVAFGDVVGAIRYEDIEIDMGTEFLFNRTIISRVGGSTEQFTDTGSADLYGIRTLSYTDLLLDSDAQSYDMGLFLLSVSADPEQRISSLSVNLARLDATQQGAVLGLDIGDVVDVLFTPTSVGAPITVSCAVEGIAIDARPGEFTMKFSLGSVTDRQVLVLDDPFWGQLDGSGVLAF